MLIFGIKECIVLLDDIVEYTIEHGANDWNYGISGAIKGEHRDIVKYLTVYRNANKC